MHFIKPFYGCRDGEIYPTQFAVGEECPPELESAAIECGVVEEPDQSGKKPAGRKAGAAGAQE